MNLHLTDYGAFVPELPECIAAGETKDEALELIIEFHIEGLKEEGKTVPKPYCDFTHVEVNAA